MSEFFWNIIEVDIGPEHKYREEQSEIAVSPNGQRVVVFQGNMIYFFDGPDFELNTIILSTSRYRHPIH